MAQSPEATGIPCAMKFASDCPSSCPLFPTIEAAMKFGAQLYNEPPGTFVRKIRRNLNPRIDKTMEQVMVQAMQREGILQLCQLFGKKALD